MLLNVNPVNFIQKINVCKPETKLAFQGSSSDVFVKKTNNVSFKGNPSFVEWAKNTDFVHTQLPIILSNSENITGRGFTHSAFNIPNNNDYILRLNNSAFGDEMDFSTGIVKETKDTCPQINIGQEVATIQLKDKHNSTTNIEVLRKQTGKPLGNPPFAAVSIEETGEIREGELPYEAKERKELYQSSLAKIAKLPVSSYEKLIEDIQIAEKSGYTLDHLNSNNLLLDEDTASINMIDMNKYNSKADYGNVLYALTNIYYFGPFTCQTDKNPVSDKQINQVLGDTITITEKFIQAMRNKNVKFKNCNNCSYQFNELVESFPFTCFFQTNDSNQKWEKLKELNVISD